MKLLSMLESSIDEALELNVAKDYAEHIRRPETEAFINKMMDKLKQLPSFTGKQSKRGERIYFNYEGSSENSYKDFDSEDFRLIKYTLDRDSELLQKLYGKTFTIESPEDYVKGLATESNGRKIGIGKLLSSTYEKLKKANDNNYATYSMLGNNFRSDRLRNDILSGDSKNKYIVISKANYDIAGMTSGRSWNSCMSLEGGNGQRYVHCDIREGTLIAYLINEKDININKPIARVLIKPFINVKNYKDYLYVVEDKVYGTAPSFGNAVKEMFKEVQPDKIGRYTLNRKLYPDSKSTVNISKKLKVFGQKEFDSYLEKLPEDEKSDKLIRISGYKIERYLDIDADSIEEISNITTDIDITFSVLNGLKKISNIKIEGKNAGLSVYDCNKLETIENVVAGYDISIRQYEVSSRFNVKKISGKSDDLTINDIDEEGLRNLDISEMDANFFYMHLFTGEELPEIKNNHFISITLFEAPKLKKLPSELGDAIRLRIPGELRDKIEIPEDVSYEINYRD